LKGFYYFSGAEERAWHHFVRVDFIVLFCLATAASILQLKRCFVRKIIVIGPFLKQKFELSSSFMFDQVL
jgi:hypothetical protein